MGIDFLEMLFDRYDNSFKNAASAIVASVIIF